MRVWGAERMGHLPISWTDSKSQEPRAGDPCHAAYIDRGGAGRYYSFNGPLRGEELFLHRLANLAERLVLNLSDAFLGDADDQTDLLQRLGCGFLR